MIKIRTNVFFAVIIFVVVLADLAVCGLISNGFIVKVLISEWILLHWCFTTNEHLLLSLSTSNIIITILAIISLFLQNQVSSSSRFQALLAYNFSAIFFRSWLTVWLSVFYCIKITISTHFLILWCKLKISWLIPRLLVGSAIIAFFVSIYAFHSILTPPYRNTTVNSTSMIQEWGPQLDDSFNIFFLSAGSACPALMMVFFSTVAVGSLCRHICRMTGKESRFRNPQTEAHIKAAGTVILLLLFHVLFYVAETLILTTNFRTKDAFSAIVLGMLYPPAQAAILVLVNPKLKQAANHMLQKISQEQTRHAVCSHV